MLFSNIVEQNIFKFKTGSNSDNDHFGCFQWCVFHIQRFLPCNMLLRNKMYCFSDMSSTGNTAFPEASVTLIIC